MNAESAKVEILQHNINLNLSIAAQIDTINQVVNPNPFINNITTTSSYNISSLRHLTNA